MAKFKISPLLVIGGIAVVGLGALYYLSNVITGGSGFGSFNPLGPGSSNILPNIFPPVGQNPYLNPSINAPFPWGTPNSLPPGSPLGIQPSLTSMQQGIPLPYQQNQFCDPTLGLNWNSLTGRCEQQLAGRNGQCAPGSVWNNCQCQCVPQGVAQPQCYRDCASSCPDKVNQIFSWCTLGCIPKSAAYGDPGLLACPPLQGSSTSVQYNLTAGGQPGVPGGLNRLNIYGQQIGIAPAVS